MNFVMKDIMIKGDSETFWKQFFLILHLYPSWNDGIQISLHGQFPSLPFLKYPLQELPETTFRWQNNAGVCAEKNEGFLIFFYFRQIMRDRIRIAFIDVSLSCYFVGQSLRYDDGPCTSSGFGCLYNLFIFIILY